MNDLAHETQNVAETNNLPAVTSDDTHLAGLPPAEQVDGLKRDYVANLRFVQDTEDELQPKRVELYKQITDLEAKYEEENATLLGVRKAAQEAADLCENALREFAHDHFTVTGEKTYDENISVRVNTKLNYVVDKAVEWAEVNAPFMIVRSVDKKAFEAVPNVDDLDFVFAEQTVLAVLKGLK